TNPVFTMETYCIPWACLDSESKQPSPIVNPPKTPKSFAQAVNNVCDIPVSQLPQACVKGDGLAIEIPEHEYLAGIDVCKHNLHGRIIWPKGSTPLTVAALKNKLAPLWKDLAKWGVSSLGKGYYEFCFSSLEDVRRVRSVASWSLNPGLLKLFAWTKDFSPRSQQNYSAQVWVRLYGLSQEYWRPNILFAIASSVGTPICTDAITAKPMIDRTFGQFARVLVDMDLTQTIRYKVLVERKGFAFFVELDYENLPAFCNNCRMIGHYVEVCKRIHLIDGTMNDTKQRNLKTQPKEAKKVYVQKQASRVEQRITTTRETIVNDDNSDDVFIMEKQPEAETSKTPADPKEAQTVGVHSQPLISQNRFDALEGQEDGEAHNQKQVENGNSQEVEDNSQSTEFVENTQMSNISKSRTGEV
ncbi:hypothetical protein A2U01_0013172, partial [Trifolium medium]|nr:hypothetical protein [Trifolium medium]